MANIYEIKKELANIYGTLEENGGELTPELEEKLTVTKANFTEKINDYSYIIQSINNDLDAIQNEINRLKELSENKTKIKQRLSKIMASAIEEFGDCKKSGVKFIDCGTKVISVRHSQSIEIDKDMLKYVSDAVNKFIRDCANYNQLDCYSKLPASNILDIVMETALVKKEGDESELKLGNNDLNALTTEVTLKIPMQDLFDKPDIYEVIKDVFRQLKYDNIELKTTTSATSLKKNLGEEGIKSLNIAKIVPSTNINIK